MTGDPGTHYATSQYGNFLNCTVHGNLPKWLFNKLIGVEDKLNEADKKLSAYTFINKKKLRKEL
jgi:hypothetical protein